MRTCPILQTHTTLLCLFPCGPLVSGVTKSKGSGGKLECLQILAPPLTSYMTLGNYILFLCKIRITIYIVIYKCIK